MNRTPRWLIAFAVSIMALPVRGAEVPGVLSTPAKAVVTHGRVLVFLQEGARAGWLRYAPLDGGPARDGPKCVKVLEPPCVWQVAYGYLWASGTDAYPPVMFGGFEFKGILDSLDRYQLDGLVDGKRISGPGAEDGISLFSFLDGRNSPLIYTRQLREKVNYEYFLAFDYLPTAEGEVRLFQLCNVAGADGPAEKHDEEEYKRPRWSLAVFRIKNEWDAKTKNWSGLGKGVSDLMGVIEPGFHEQFRVLGKGDDYYFVTDSGKLFRAPKPDKGADRDLEAVWNDAKRPVAAFITDADADRTFLFCKPDKDGKGVYFEMSDKPDLQPYDASKIPAAKIEDQLPAVLAYAKILVADKKIKEKE